MPITIELVAIDRFTARAVTAGEVTTLEHELGDDTVEGRSRVTKTMDAGSELAEVLGCYRHDVVVELEDDASSVLVVDCDVKLGKINSRSGEIGR